MPSTSITDLAQRRFEGLRDPEGEQWGAMDYSRWTEAALMQLPQDGSQKSMAPPCRLTIVEPGTGHEIAYWSMSQPWSGSRHCREDARHAEGRKSRSIDDFQAKRYTSSHPSRAKDAPIIGKQQIPQSLLSSHHLDNAHLLNTFITHCLPLGSSISQEVPLQWLQSVAFMTGDCNLLTLAISALGLGWAGHIADQPRCVENGLERYISAVSAMRQDISSASATQMISAISLLTLYELYEFGSELSKGWATHLNGIKSIFQVLGPFAAESDPFYRLFLFYRIIEVVTSFRKHEKTWLADPSWMTIPWIGKKRTAFQYFFDLVAEATGLLEYADALDATIHPDSPEYLSLDEAAKNLVQMILALVRRIQKWQRAAGIRMFQGPPVFTPSAHGSTTSTYLERYRMRGYPDTALNSSGVDFDTLQTARLMHIYWTVLLELHMLMVSNSALRSKLAPFMEDGSEYGVQPGHVPTEISVRAKCRLFANDISLYGEFCSQNIWQSFGPMTCKPQSVGMKITTFPRMISIQAAKYTLITAAPCSELCSPKTILV
ncbi:hypothetical protein BX600DRAFT_434932 [Xylariales sp. PMI_506]|nr:hypothetical protein BX600DRAFT_434932 [Xylariales sp. PMI_506]